MKRENGHKKILVADDEPGIRRNLQLRLEAAGLTCITASNGKEAVDLAKKERPALIMLDLQMPEMDGLQAYKILQDDPKTKNIRVIFFTAHDPSTVMEKGMEAIDKLDFIFKPFDEKAISLLVETALDCIPEEE